MIKSLDSKNRVILGQWLLTLFVPLVIVGKILRWTILRDSTANMGIGHGMVAPIINGRTHFRFYWEGGSATGNANYIFSFFNLFHCETFEEFEVGISILFNSILFFFMFWFVVKNRGVTWVQLACLCMFIGVLNIYTFTLSKEAAQMLYYIIMWSALFPVMPIRRKELAVIGVMILMIITTRFYLVLMLAFAVGIRLSYTYLYKILRGNTVKLMVIFLLVGSFVYYLFLNYCRFASPSDFAELIRVRTRQSVATTDIRAVIPTNTLELFSINYLITAVRMLFPVELLRFGPKYFIYVLFQLIVSRYMIRNLANYLNLSSTKQLVTCLYWGYFFCSVTFEPDFGSWVRHESVTFPMLLFAFTDRYDVKDIKPIHT